MGTSFRSVFAVLLIGLTLGAAAVAPAHSRGGDSADFAGSWITWAGTGEDGQPPVCRRLVVTAAGPHARGGTWDAPGWQGLVDGRVAPTDGGGTEWRGEWRDGQIAGTFALTLRGHDAFQGTFAGAGLPAAQRWNGVRAPADGTKRVPCRMAH